MTRILQAHSEFFESSPVHYPGSVDYINSLETFKVTDNFLTKKQHHCTICSGPFVINEELNSLECGHLYHSICIKAWLSKVSNLVLLFDFQSIIYLNGWNFIVYHVSNVLS